MSHLPREHGAYAQLAIPLITTTVVAGPSVAGALTATAAIVGFLAHEPAAVLGGTRGLRASKAMRSTAVKWLACWVSIGVAAGVAAVSAMGDGERWSLLVPLVPAGALMAATFFGKDKSLFGEISGAFACAGVAVPIALAAGYSIQTALAIAIPFAMLFVVGTLAVRIVILRVRGGGNARATLSTRVGVFILVVAATAALVWATAAELLPLTVLIAVAPGLGAAIVVAANPPAPLRLRALGWTLVGTTLFSALTTIATTP